MDFTQNQPLSSDDSVVVTKQRDETLQFMEISDDDEPTTNFSSSSSTFTEITHISETTNSKTPSSCKYKFYLT